MNTDLERLVGNNYNDDRISNFQGEEISYEKVRDTGMGSYEIKHESILCNGLSTNVCLHWHAFKHNIPNIYKCVCKHLSIIT